MPVFPGEIRLPEGGATLFQRAGSRDERGRRVRRAVRGAAVCGGTVPVAAMRGRGRARSRRVLGGAKRRGQPALRRSGGVNRESPIGVVNRQSGVVNRQSGVGGLGIGRWGSGVGDRALGIGVRVSFVPPESPTDSGVRGSGCLSLWRAIMPGRGEGSARRFSFPRGLLSSPWNFCRPSGTSGSSATASPQHWRAGLFSSAPSGAKTLGGSQGRRRTEDPRMMLR
ncbi:MAG: hypothetical protein FLDDKLPJ_00330 [Phycisphaerae bacterium]|nr:hypothetical protein [Phycisphaerae bacterium]